LKPSFISTWKNIIQIIFKLEAFIDKEKESVLTLPYLASTTRIFEKKIKCKKTNKLINPFCKDVNSYIFNVRGQSLKEIETAAYHPVSAEHKKEAKRRGALAANKVQSDKSHKKIKEAILVLITMDGFPTKVRVSKFAGVCRQTVYRHWKPVISEIQAECVLEP
jgi:hypothetical protein